jgi:tetratricopeptide (TPR) repeat protein
MGQKAPNAGPASPIQTDAGRAPSAQSSAAETRRLAEMFAGEPELISACLRGAETKPRAWVRTILAAAQQALAEHPDYADLHYHSSQASVAAGEYDNAARLLDNALRMNSAYRDARLLAGRVALLRQRPQEARAHLETAITQGADYPDVHLLLGSVARDCGNWDRARQSFERALELNAGLTEARTALAALPPAGTIRGAE